MLSESSQEQHTFFETPQARAQELLLLDNESQTTPSTVVPPDETLTLFSPVYKPSAAVEQKGKPYAIDEDRPQIRVIQDDCEIKLHKKLLRPGR
jgi:hypothetical protein